MSQTLEACAQALGVMFTLMLALTPTTAIASFALAARAKTGMLAAKTRRMLENLAILSLPTTLTMGALAIILHNIALITLH